MMDDLISRQAAIDALRTCQTYLFVSYDDDKKISLESAEYMIEQLPSAQPEIIRCMDCKHYKDGECTNTFWGMCERDYCSEGERKNDEIGS